jgi:activator of HSP90 ATPase
MHQQYLFLLHNRKLIAFYQLDVSVGWKGTWKQSDETVITASGKVNMPYISDENDLDEFEIQVTLENDATSNKQHRELKDIVYKRVGDIVRPSIVTLLTELKAGANVAEKYKDWEREELARQERERLAKSTNSNNDQLSEPSVPSVQQQPQQKSKALATVKFTERLRAPLPLIYAAFVETDRLSAVTRAPALVEKRVGGKVMMFAGNVTGEIVELIENKKIVEKWRFKEWPTDHYSKLVVEFEESGGETVVHLTQTDIPFNQDKKVEEGWRNNFFNGLKIMLGMVIGGM